MIKVKDTKLSADIEDDVTQYVTFWGKLKGDITKQEDLVDLVKKNISKLDADVKDEFKRISRKVLEIKYDEKELLNVDEVDANKDKLIFKASNKASGNSQDIALLREEALTKYVDEKADEIANFVYQFILDKGIVDDPEYVHTDNNYTNNDKAIVSLVPEIQSSLEHTQEVLAQFQGTIDKVLSKIADTNIRLNADEEDIASLKGVTTELNDKATLADQKIEAINTSLDEHLQEIEKSKVSINDIYPDFDSLDENSEYALRLVNDSSEGWCFIWVPVEVSEY